MLLKLSVGVNKTCAGSIEVFMEKADCVDETANGGQSRTLTAVDENDLRMALMELKTQFSVKSGSFFDPTSSHGFTEQLVNDIVKDVSNIFSFKYWRKNFPYIPPSLS